MAHTEPPELAELRARTVALISGRPAAELRALSDDPEWQAQVDDHEWFLTILEHFPEPSPCPPWCAEQHPAHVKGWEECLSSDERLQRIHARRFGPLSMWQEETAERGGQPVFGELNLTTGDELELTAAGAWELSRHAAEAARALTGAQRGEPRGSAAPVEKWATAEDVARLFPPPGGCPPWCEMTAGHGWEDITLDDTSEPYTIGRWHRAARGAWLIDQLETVNTAGYLISEAAQASSGPNGALGLAEMLGADQALALLRTLPTAPSDAS